MPEGPEVTKMKDEFKNLLCIFLNKKLIIN